MKRTKKILLSVLSLCLVACFSLSFVFAKLDGNVLASVGGAVSDTIDKVITRLDDALVKYDIENYLDEEVVFKLPDNVSADEEISVIVEMSEKPLYEEYKQTDYATVGDYSASEEGRKKAAAIKSESEKLIRKLADNGIIFTVGEMYDTLISGFEIVIKASQFSAVNNILNKNATLILGDTYEKCQTDVVKNYVDVYSTGIFDSSSISYQGDGVVVAILDTGLDYTHSAFSVDRFHTENEAFTLQTISEKIADTKAAEFTSGLSAEDVYVSSKVPYAYDYADKDSDVLPINSEHGTHVAGIIAGHDDQITGVAPNAQLAIFKVFSDIQEGAKDSWILAALEDCVTLGVDVINMSLGTSCGFTREVDKENKNDIYDRINDAGISLVTAASNDGVATSGSSKNGSNPLTKNPDYGTVGSPSTYESALSVASVDGVETPYMLYKDQIIYFTEATAYGTHNKSFVDDILKTVGNVDSYDFKYVTIPGIGRASDYPADASYYAGKIVLVKRGETTFEEKIRIALKEKGAAGVIIYNNISGKIAMSVGADIGACCSLAQDEGELLASAGEGTIRISRSQLAGPFMSDFSSWGPTSDLKIKPEITAHGGEIYSAVPGQSYDRLSGTSMACPNQAGATALVRQYVKDNENVFGKLTSSQINSRVYQLMMSSADIVLNKSGLPFAVRKQGAGLVNIKNAITTAAYITTYDSDGNAMDKTKFELGDDKNKTGVYELTFDINNISTDKIEYDVTSVVLSEGVSTTYTSHSDTTVTMDGYELKGANTSVMSVTGGTQDGNHITVAAKSSAKVTVKITLSAEDKKYIDDNFENGMYVEGFLKFTATKGTTVNMNAPFLAFYGTWNQAPVLDEEYYDTNVDEYNNGLNDEDKLMEDAYASRAVGGLYNDYIAYLGSFYFIQDENSNRIAANKEHISLSNQNNGSSSTINSLNSIYLGLLRNAKEVNISIVDSVTGEEIFNHSEYNILKSRSYGSNMSPGIVDVDFSVPEYNLKNNTKYEVTVTAYTDYEDHATQSSLNKRNVFKFPLYIDFEAPIVTDVLFRTETERDSAGQTKTKYFADISIYDNHYTMAASVGCMNLRYNEEEGRELYSLSSFNKYMIPIVSSYNSVSTISFELTDYISEIRKAKGLKINEDGTTVREENTGRFCVACYDYAMNSSMFEIKLPDVFTEISFAENEIKLSPNETVDIATIINAYPSESWITTLDFSSSDKETCDVVDQKLLAKKSGAAIITATGKDANGNIVSTELKVTVLDESDDGYVGNFTLPTITSFAITGYRTDFAYYEASSEDRDIGLTGSVNPFDGSETLEMYPDEKITILYRLSSYFPEKMSVVFKSSNGRSSVAQVRNTQTGELEWQIRALEKGSTRVTINVVNTETGKTEMSKSVYITVKDPYTVNSIYLMSYKGLGGEVKIPSELGVTTIYEYAFSNSKRIPKDLDNGDVINDEDPYYTKPTYIGNDTITKVIIPEGVIEIQGYAFAGLTALEEVVLPSTLTKIGSGAFYGCTNLKKINLESAKFINQYAFYNNKLSTVDLSSVVAIGNYAFANNLISSIELPLSSQSIGIGSFENNTQLKNATFNAPKIKLGTEAFMGCSNLETISVNAAVISSYAFANCSKLTTVILGEDVSIIGDYAFAGTNVSKFMLDNNSNFTTKEGGALLYKGNELALCAPKYSGSSLNTVTLDDQTTSIGSGAFAGNRVVFTVKANNVAKIGNFAFANCSNLKNVEMPNLEVIGDYAFAATGLTETPDLSGVNKIGLRAFQQTQITSVNISENTEVGDYAFALCVYLRDVTIGNGSVIGEAAFYNPVNNYTLNPSSMTFEQMQTLLNQYYTTYDYDVKDEEGNTVKTYTYYKYNFAAGAYSVIKNVTIGDNVTIGNLAFYGNPKISEVTLGSNAVIGNFAFYNCAGLNQIDLSNAKSIGEYAFSGAVDRDYTIIQNSFETQTLGYALELKMVNGEEVAQRYMLTSFAPSLTTVDLTNVKELGEAAFANNRSLSGVTLNSELTAIPYGLFANCNLLTNIDLPQTLTEIGGRAFYGTALTAAEISNAVKIGEYAFYANDLKNITLAVGATIGDEAFGGNRNLAQAVNLDKAVFIGAYAFANTALTELTVNAEEIGDFAFANTNISKVVFGNNVKALGENPFFNCPITTFGVITDVDEGNSAKVENDYDISDTVFVRDGVLYQKLENGKFELVTFPSASALEQYQIIEQTARISATAFAYCDLKLVKLPLTLKAIGDKAFYKAENLDMVLFTSYNAPALEEEYDQTYISLSNLSTNNENVYGGVGLGITDYFKWNFTDPTNFFYGANFVDYVGKVNNKLVMFRPSNGVGYDSFILGMYFDTVYEGALAPTDATLAVIELIDKIPDYVTLEYRELIESARSAYNRLASLEQQSLVTNYEKLTNAESVIDYLTPAPTAVIDMIAALPEPENVTLADEEAIVNAREAYNTLSDIEKEKCSNYDKLVSVEYRLAKIKSAQGDSNSSGDEKGNSNAGLIVATAAGFSLAVLVAIAFAVYVFMTKKEKNGGNGQPTYTEEISSTENSQESTNSTEDNGLENADNADGTDNADGADNRQ